MEANSTSETAGQHTVVDCATLFLCRQGQTWVVVLESPRFTGAMLLRHPSPDAYDARFELLSRVRHACPDAAVVTADGAAEGADYEWRLEVHGVQTNAGDLGVALREELSGKRPPHQRRLLQRHTARTCRTGWFPSSSSRPLFF